MKSLVRIIIALAVPGVSLAEEAVPLQMPNERKALDIQAEEFTQAITPTLTKAALSTVRVWSDSRRVAYGTVIGDGTQILSKWSEIARHPENLQVDVAGEEYRSVRLGGVYKDEDLVVLEIEGKPLTPVRWSSDVPKLGSILAAPQPDGRLAASGVVSVLERNLRDTDLAFLGVFGDPDYRGPGIKIARVAEDSGAADVGLRPGSIILKVADRSISGLLELKNALVGKSPGTTVPLLVETRGTARTVDVLLRNRPEIPQFSGDRLQAMERMGGAISRVRDSFTHAIQTDMRPKPNQIGGPVVNLKGEVVGITIARADRTRSFIMPANAVVNLLKKDAVNPDLAQIRMEEAPAQPQADGGGRQRRELPGGEDRMRLHLSDMQRLMDHLREEMDSIEEP
jgi:serine protease Do